MTLEEAIARALKHSPEIIQAQGSIRTAAAAERSAFGASLPGLSASASSSLSSSERFNPTTGTPVTGSNDSYNAGLSASWDVLRAQLELNTARESLLQFENQRLTAALSLGRLVGLEQPVDPTPSGPTEPTPIQESREAVVSTLVTQAPSIRSAEASLLSAEAGIGTARSQYYPSVRLSAGYDWFNQDFGLTSGRTGWSVRLGLSYPIFDGFQREEAWCARGRRPRCLRQPVRQPYQFVTSARREGSGSDAPVH